MKRILSLTYLLFLIASCTKEKHNLYITGDINGLKKGSIYLQKIDDTSLVNIDSVAVSGSSKFEFKTYIDQAQVMFIELDRYNDENYAELIKFFAEPGEVHLKTSLKNYGIDLEVSSGFQNQKKLEEYNQMISKFNADQLDLIEANFKANQSQEEQLIDSINKRYNALLRRKYLYTVNFALNNKNLEVSPYVILTQAFDANIKYLDTVYNGLEASIQKSLYGAQLKDLIEQRRTEENQNTETEVINEETK